MARSLAVGAWLGTYYRGLVRAAPGLGPSARSGLAPKTRRVYPHGCTVYLRFLRRPSHPSRYFSPHGLRRRWLTPICTSGSPPSACCASAPQPRRGHLPHPTTSSRAGCTTTACTGRRSRRASLARHSGCQCYLPRRIRIPRRRQQSRGLRSSRPWRSSLRPLPPNAAWTKRS